MTRLVASLLIGSMLTLVGCSEPEKKEQIKDSAANTGGEAKKELKMTPTEPL
jgi:PBP1b-binding outer membrane lipoprotein LpoB